MSTIKVAIRSATKKWLSTHIQDSNFSRIEDYVSSLVEADVSMQKHMEKLDLKCVCPICQATEENELSNVIRESLFDDDMDDELVDEMFEVEINNSADFFATKVQALSPDEAMHLIKKIEKEKLH